VRIGLQRALGQYLVRAVGEHALLIGISKVHGWRVFLAKSFLAGEQATPSSRAMSSWPVVASVARLRTIMP
jgi:erythromycin esterase-like protein